MTAGTPHRSGALHDVKRSFQGTKDREVARLVRRRSLRRLGVGVAGTVALSATARAHGAGRGALGSGDGAASFLIVLGLPACAGLVGGVVAVGSCGRSRSEPLARRSGGAVGLLLVGIGGASLLAAATGHLWVSAAGGFVGGATAMWFDDGDAASEIGCGTHAELTLGAIIAHRLLEGVALGALYTTGAAIGLVAAAVLAGHATLETAAVGGLYAGTKRRVRVVGAVVLVQVGYLVGTAVGLEVAGEVPGSANTFVLAVVGGVLLLVGAREAERSVAAGRPAGSANDEGGR